MLVLLLIFIQRVQCQYDVIFLTNSIENRIYLVLCVMNLYGVMENSDLDIKLLSNLFHLSVHYGIITKSDPRHCSSS